MLDMTNPDLALYEGEADEIYKDGKRVERSIYSRPWRSSPSKETQLEVEVEGLWETNAEGVRTKSLDNGNTFLTITCQHGMAQHITLTTVK
jgi:chondroitin-sulfate-ABC endolyase/exolyase